MRRPETSTSDRLAGLAELHALASRAGIVLWASLLAVVTSAPVECLPGVMMLIRNRDVRSLAAPKCEYFAAETIRSREGRIAYRYSVDGPLD